MQKYIFLLFWQSAMKYPVRTITAVVGATLTSIVGGFIGPLIIAQILERIQSGTISLDSSWTLIVLYTITQVYGQIVGWRINYYCLRTMEALATKDLYDKIFSKLTEHSLNFHSDRFGGSLVSQTSKLIGSFGTFWDTVVFTAIPTTASLVAATIILSFYFWQYAVVLLIISSVYIVAVYYGSGFMSKRYKEESQANTASNGYVADAVTNVMTIKSHGHEDVELKTLNTKVENWRQKALHTMRGFIRVSTAYSSLTTIMNLIAIVAAIIAVENKSISIGAVYLAVSYTFTITGRLWDTIYVMSSYNRIIGDAHDMTEILRLKPSVKDLSNDSLVISDGYIKIDNMSFSHKGHKEKLFENFNLHIKPNQRVGLVGVSGSGKTTLTKLLLRFSDVTDGTIEIDGQDIKMVTQHSLRRSIAYVPQEPMLFHRSISENIAYGKLGSTKAEILEAAEKAQAKEFIEKLPKGFDTLVGERGVKLSGGQRQRIAIARAILKDAPIIVLDEATSALDSESERLIQNALKELMQDRTSIVIAHRLSTISHLDRIIVLHDGKIVEDGTHKELLQRKGTYAKLWSHQSGGFLED